MATSNQPTPTTPAADRLAAILAVNGMKGECPQLVPINPPGCGRCSLSLHGAIRVDTDTGAIRELVAAGRLTPCREELLHDRDGNLVGTTLFIGSIALADATHFRVE